MNILLASSLPASKTFCERVLFFGATCIHCESIQVQFNILSQEEAFLQSKVQNMAHDVKKTWCSKVVQTLNSTREIETSFTSATVFAMNLCTFKLHVGRYNDEHREGVHVLRAAFTAFRWKRL